MPTLKPGDEAPDFTLVDQYGQSVKLKSFRGNRVVVYFYPKALTSGCTTQACSLRDAGPEPARLGAYVIGVSPDPPARLRKFDDRYKLDFPLLSDEGHVVAEAWGVWGEKSLYGRRFQGVVRSAFVLDERGRVIDAFYKVSPKDTVAKVREALRP